MDKFKLALVQMDCEFLDVDANIQKAEEQIRIAHENGAQFVCLPEGFNTGYYCFDYPSIRDLAEPLDGKTITKMRALAKELAMYIVAPIMMSVGTGIVENTAVFIDDEGNVLGTYSKTHLVGSEQIYLKRGTQYPVFRTKYGTIGIVICYDICFPETAAIVANKGADLIICPAAWRDGSYFKNWLELDARARALDNTVFVALLNRCGALPDSPFCGSTQVVSPIGEVLGKCSVDKEEILYQDIDMSLVHEVRKENTILIDRHPEDYGPLTM